MSKLFLIYIVGMNEDRTQVAWRKPLAIIEEESPDLAAKKWCDDRAKQINPGDVLVPKGMCISELKKPKVLLDIYVPPTLK